MAVLTILDPTAPLHAFSHSNSDELPDPSTSPPKPVGLRFHITDMSATSPASASPPSPTSPTHAQSARDLDHSLLFPPNTLSPRPRRSSSPGPGLGLRRASSVPPVLWREDIDEPSSDTERDSTDFIRPRPRTLSTGALRPVRPPVAHTSNFHGSENRFHSDLTLPPPPVYKQVSVSIRPKTFWRNTRRSGLTAPSYSPSSHLIRRSTFIAAGLTLDAPHADLSALCVEARVGAVVLPPGFASFSLPE